MPGPRLLALAGGALIFLTAAAGPSGRSMSVLRLPADQGPDYVAWVSAPRDGIGPASVVYVLDGRQHIASLLAWIDAPERPDATRGAIFVFVGYDSDRPETTERRRLEDFTTPADLARLSERVQSLRPRLGGMERFLTFLHSGLLPRVADLEPTDDRCEVLAGHSLAGLAVLHDYLDADSPFDRWVAVSPSVWWNDREILAAAPRTAHEEQAVLKVFVGEDEQRRSPPGDPGGPYVADRFRMIENARAFVDRANLQAPGEATIDVIPGADHDGAAIAGFASGLDAALDDCGRSGRIQRLAGG